MTNSEQILYNMFLRISKQMRNKPYNLRKDFSDFENNPIYPILKRLNLFFEQNNQINIEIFLKAPYIIYKDEEYFPLDYYLTMKAVKCYRLYYEYLDNIDPDDEKSLTFIQNSLKYIYEYCKKFNISINDYLLFKEEGNVTFPWERHIKDHLISFYVLFYFENFQSILFKIPKDEQEIFLCNVTNYYSSYKQKYLNSKIAKIFIEKGFEKLKIKLTEIK